MSLNLDNLKWVLNLIEESEEYVASHPEARPLFKYSLWKRVGDNLGKRPEEILRYPCGTQCCIGGWGSFRLEADTGHFSNNEDVVAAEVYGMTPKEGWHLFYGGWHRSGLNAPTPEVILKLRNIIETGKVINPEFDSQYLHPVAV